MTGESAWLPISGAPRDGTLIDIWREGEFPARVPNVSWRVPSDSEWWVHGGDTIQTPDATWHDMFGPLGKDEQPHEVHGELEVLCRKLRELLRKELRAIGALPTHGNSETVH